MRAGCPSTAQCSLLLACLACLAGPGRAQDRCAVAELGTLSGVMGIHSQMLPPGRFAHTVNIPPVCATLNGVRAVACEAEDAEDEADAEDAEGEPSVPSVWLRGGAVELQRRGDAAGFALLSVMVYCAPAVPRSPPITSP